MKKEITEITFADGTKGTITTETITGRVDVKATYNNMTDFYFAERKGRNWIVKICVNGFCNDAVIMVNTKTRSAAISEIIQNVKRNQSITADSKELPTPSDEPKTEEEEEAAAQHFINQMSDAESDINTMISKQKINSYYGMIANQMSDTEPEYMGIDYMDARRFNNWQKLLIEKLYDGNTEHDKIYCNTNYGKIFGWFLNKKGSEQFQLLYGGDMQEVDSDIYFISEIHDLFLEIICGVETDEISIESQLIEKNYLNNRIENIPEYIFYTLQSYTYLFELTKLLSELKRESYVKEIEKYLIMTNRDLLYKIKDPEKTILAFCKDMEYLTERIIADYFAVKHKFA